MYPNNKLALLSLLLILIAACGKPPPPPGPDGGSPSPVTFTVSAQTHVTSGGDPCLAFTALPSEDVTLVSVRVTNPIQQSITYNMNGHYVLENEPVELQESGTCYIKRSGAYSFAFKGTRVGGASFTSDATYNSQ